MNHGFHQAKLEAIPATQPRAMADLTASSTVFSTAPRAIKLRQASSRPSAEGNRTRLPLGFALTLNSDSGILGDRKTSFAAVDVIGLTAPNARITLAGLKTTAAADGRFLFTNLPLPLGKTELTATARLGTVRSHFTSQITRVSADHEDAVVTWNAVTLRTLQLDQAASLEASRTLAITHSAIYNAVKGVISQIGSLTSNQTASNQTASNPENQTRESIAVAAAAHRILTQLYPNQKLQLDSALANSLDGSSTSAPSSPSFLLGQTVADQILAQRSQDGSDRNLTDQRPAKPGKWRPTAPRFLPAAGVAWAQVTPFVLKQPNQFRPSPPPRLTGATYAKELNQVKHLGQINSHDRTATQTDIARFWIGSAETGTFPGLWNQIAAQLTVQQPVQQAAGELASLSSSDSLLQNARRFAQLNLALADAGIAAWDAKYAYRSWRPITAIRLAGSDRNPATKADPQWESYLETPAHPDYVSGHSTFSGAAAAILTQNFVSQPFDVTSLDLPGQSRHFQSFRQAAAEAGMSRIYGGIHTMSANRAGQKLGRNVANFVLDQFDTLT